MRRDRSSIGAVALAASCMLGVDARTSTAGATGPMPFPSATASGSRDQDGLPSVGDFDGDGAEDIAWYDPSTGEGVLWCGGDRLTGISLRPGGGFRFDAGDFDADGVFDFIWHQPGGPTVLWYG
jgi:hypothetical protein